MEHGLSFLKSKIARRFCTLFILSAFIPVLILALFSYYKVVNQLEEQSLLRLKREAKAYGIGLFDRLIRVEKELYIISRNIESVENRKILSNNELTNNLSDLLRNISVWHSDGRVTTVFGSLNPVTLTSLVSKKHLSSSKPFILSIKDQGQPGRLFLGGNFIRLDGSPVTLVGEINPEYLWGVGGTPLLPPMTDLLVFDAEGNSLIVTMHFPLSNYRDLYRKYDSDDPQVFHFEIEGKQFFGSFSNIFFESRFQRTGWVITLVQARSNIMSALDQFSTTFPFIILLFLLLSLFLSVKFIRRTLEPLEILKKATDRVADQNFSRKVEIESDDEFAELGTAFNIMSRKIESQFQTMETVGEIDRAILSSTDRATIISTTLQRLKSFFNCDIALYALTPDNMGDFLKVYCLKGRRADDPYVEYFNIDTVDTDLLFNTQRHITLNKGDRFPAFLSNEDETSITKYLGLPIEVDGEIRRILLLGWKSSFELSEDEQANARQIADQLAVALTNANLMTNLENLATGTIEALARTVDAKSRWTSGHSERVAELSARIAHTMGFSDTEVAVIKRAGLMHDIGKIGISLTILDKPGRLNDSEYREVKNHPSIGAKILEPIDAFQDILTIVEQHHEKVDGSGYPAGLQGEEIDIKARILAVADVWDALVSDRPYRDGWVHDRAKKLISEGSGSHFDSQVVKAFFATIDSE